METSSTLPMHPPRLNQIKQASMTTVSTRPPSAQPTLEAQYKVGEPRIVRIRLVFIHIGEIDTLNERYQADVYYEARWIEKTSNLSNWNLTPQQEIDLVQNQRTIRVEKIDSPTVWSPQLFIENAIGNFAHHDRWFTIEPDPTKTPDLSSTTANSLEICEHRRMTGVFWEKLELNHFPADVQDLTISITTNYSVDECSLIQDERFRSLINRESFSDQQKWSLYEHVAIEARQTQEEYFFGHHRHTSEPEKHPVLSVTCRAARRPGYYYWNAFYLIFLITISAFCIFAIHPDLPQNRLQITCTLLLTSVTFRWVVNRSLPTVYYLTTLDIYAISSIMILVCLCIWHSIVATVIFYNEVKSVTPDSVYIAIDRYVMIGMFVIYSAIHAFLIIWLITGPYKRRREMTNNDRKYRENRPVPMKKKPFRSRHGSTMLINNGTTLTPIKLNRNSVSPDRPVRPPKLGPSSNQNQFFSRSVDTWSSRAGEHYFEDSQSVDQI